MEEQNVKCKFKFFVNGLKFMFLDIGKVLANAWRNLEHNGGQNAGFIELFVFFSVLAAVIAGVLLSGVLVVEAFYLVGLISFTVFGAPFDISTAPLWWRYASAEHASVFFEGFLMCIIIFAGAFVGWKLDNILNAICKRGQPGSSRMFNV